MGRDCFGFPDLLRLESGGWDDEDFDEGRVDEDRAYDRWIDQQIMNDYEKEYERAMSKEMLKVSDVHDIEQESHDGRKNVQGK